MKSLVLLCLLAVPLLSGCASNDAADPPADGAGPATPDEAAPAPVPEPGNTDTPRAVRETAFAKDGATGTGACAYVVGTGDCVWPYSDNFLVLEFPGDATRVQGTLTWTSAGGAAPALALSLMSEEDGAWTWHEGFFVEPTASGEIAFDWDASRLAGRGLGLAVSSFNGAGALVAYAGASATVPFHLEGTVTSAV